MIYPPIHGNREPKQVSEIESLKNTKKYEKEIYAEIDRMLSKK